MKALTDIEGGTSVISLDIETCAPSRQTFSILYLDLDRLKYINGYLGNDIGAEFLCTVAKMLIAVFWESDVIGRVGRDQFVVAGEGSATEMNKAYRDLKPPSL